MANWTLLFVCLTLAKFIVFCANGDVIDVGEGQTATIPCLKADAVKKSQVKWSYGTRPKKQKGKYKVDGQGQLTVRKVSAQDSGELVCKPRDHPPSLHQLLVWQQPRLAYQLRIAYLMKDGLSCKHLPRKAIHFLANDVRKQLCTKEGKVGKQCLFKIDPGQCQRVKSYGRDFQAEVTIVIQFKFPSMRLSRLSSCDPKCAFYKRLSLLQTAFNSRWLPLQQHGLSKSSSYHYLIPAYEVSAEHSPYPLDNFDNVTMLCGPGSSPESKETCRPCSPGMYSPNLGTGVCKPCSIGTYQSKYGATRCLACPHGFTRLPGARSKKQCADNESRGRRETPFLSYKRFLRRTKRSPDNPQLQSSKNAGKAIKAIKKIRELEKKRHEKKPKKEMEIQKKIIKKVKVHKKPKYFQGQLVVDNPLSKVVKRLVVKRQAVFVDMTKHKDKETLETVLEEDLSLRDKDIMRLKKETVRKDLRGYLESHGNTTTKNRAIPPNNTATEEDNNQLSKHNSSDAQTDFNASVTSASQQVQSSDSDSNGLVENLDGTDLSQPDNDTVIDEPIPSSKTQLATGEPNSPSTNITDDEENLETSKADEELNTDLSSSTVPAQNTMRPEVDFPDSAIKCFQEDVIARCVFGPLDKDTDACEFESREDGTQKWSILQGKDVRPILKYDHTRKTEEGYLMLTEKAHLNDNHTEYHSYSAPLSVLVPITRTDNYVVRFWYKMQGPRNGSLSVYGVDEDWEKLLPAFSSQQGHARFGIWQSGELKLPHTTTRVLFQAIFNRNPYNKNGPIYVDDILYKVCQPDHKKERNSLYAVKEEDPAYDLNLTQSDHVTSPPEGFITGSHLMALLCFTLVVIPNLIFIMYKLGVNCILYTSRYERSKRAKKGESLQELSKLLQHGDEEDVMASVQKSRSQPPNNLSEAMQSIHLSHEAIAQVDAIKKVTDWQMEELK